MPEVITNNLDLWSSALLTKSTAGRGSNGKLEAYGIKKLRELILELAISGRLLGNDTSGWTEALLGEIGDWGSGGTPLKTHSEYYGGDIPWLVIGDLNDGLVTKAQSCITQLGLEKSSAQLVREGTLLIAMYGSIGKLGIAGIPCATNQAIAFCSPDSEQIETQYLFLYLRAIRKHLLSRGQGLAQQNISQKILKATSIKLPSLEEQHRIVAKVDELMALCDQLEQQQTDSIAAHQTLVASLLGTLTRVETQQEFSAAWARIASHFDTLFTTEASIDQLKQTILQLAVMGKLVPQDTNAEPARELLKCIQAEKAKLIAEGKIKKEKPLPDIGEDEKPFELPVGWEWARLDAITSKITDGEHISPLKTEAGMKLLTAKHVLDDGITLEDPQYVSLDDGIRFRERCDPKTGDVLICSRGTIGRCCAIEVYEEFCLMGSVILARPSGQIAPRYLACYLKSEAGQFFIRGATKGMAVNALYLKDIRLCSVPVPPRAEQHRIVAKVDELMALCDVLKVRLADAQAIQLHLADAIVEQAVC